MPRRVDATRPCFVFTVPEMTDSSGLTPLTEAQRADVTAALLAFWTARDEAAAAQAAKGNIQTSTLSSVTAGNHLDRVAQLVARLCVAAGAPTAQVYFNAPPGDPMKRPGAGVGYTLPGYFRPSKQWDICCYANGKPIVAVELKSQVGSFGNNANNRAEEAIGSATDLREAMRTGLINSDLWIGYVFVMEDSQGATDPITGNASLLAKDPIFGKASYADRIRRLSERLVESGLYRAAWPVATTRPPDFKWKEMSPVESGYAKFANSLQAHVRKHYPDRPADVFDEDVPLFDC